MHLKFALLTKYLSPFFKKEILAGIASPRNLQKLPPRGLKISQISPRVVKKQCFTRFQDTHFCKRRNISRKSANSWVEIHKINLKNVIILYKSPRNNLLSLLFTLNTGAVFANFWVMRF